MIMQFRTEKMQTDTVNIWELIPELKHTQQSATHGFVKNFQC